MKKLVIVVIPLVLLLAVGIGAVSWMRSNGAKNDDATPVRVEPVIRGELVELVQAPGEIQPRTKVSISARVAARINELPIAEGGKVKKDDIVVLLDSVDLQAGLRSTEARYAAQKAQSAVEESHVKAQRAQVTAAAATLADAERDLARQNSLLATGDVSQTTVDQAKRRFDEQSALLDAARETLTSMGQNLVVLKHTLDSVDADISRARDNLSYTTIRSPIDGVLTKLNAKIGELVVTGTLNTPGTVILEIADFSEMLLLARVDEANIASVKVGQKARIHTQAYGDRVFDGVVETVAMAQSGTATGSQQVSSSTTRYFKVEILVNTGGDRIFSGLTSDVDIETQRHTNVLKVPSQAVLGRTTDELPSDIRDNSPHVNKGSSQTTVVYRLIDGKAVVTPVVVGPSDLTYTLIKAGLSEGDKIITGPYKVLEKIAHDQKVKDDKPTTQPAKDGKKPATAPSAATGADDLAPMCMSRPVVSQPSKAA